MVALEAKLLLRTSKQGGGSGARHQGLRRAVCGSARQSRTCWHGHQECDRLVPLVSWGIGFLCVCCKDGSESESLQGLQQEAGVLRG